MKSTSFLFKVCCLRLKIHLCSTDRYMRIGIGMIRIRLFSPRSSLTLEFPAPQRTRTIQVPRARFLPKKPVKIVPFARIPGQTSPANLEAVNELCQKARGVEGCGYLEDDAGGSEIGVRGVERGGPVGADGRDGEERRSGGGVAEYHRHFSFSTLLVFAPSDFWCHQCLPN